MQAAWYGAFGAAAAVLQVGEREAPTAGPGEVLVQAASTRLAIRRVRRWVIMASTR